MSAWRRRPPSSCSGRRVIDDLAAVGVDMGEVSHTLESEGVAAFAKSYDELMAVLQDKAAQLGAA